jgi:CheY-like chemotaxis protein
MFISILDDDDDFCKAIEKWTESYLKRERQKLIQLVFHKTGTELFTFLKTLDVKRSGNTILLLDLDFDGSKTAGINALRQIRSSRKTALRKLPIIIYSNSDDPSEIDQCYLRFANSYVWKGPGPDQKKRFLELVDYWAETASLPGDPTTKKPMQEELSNDHRKPR